VKRCVLTSLSLLLAFGSVQAEQAPAGPTSDFIFLWLAGGLSSARIQRLATQNKSFGRSEPSVTSKVVSCHATLQCARALQKAGADSALIQHLGWTSTGKSTAHPLCSCASAAAQIAALIHDKNFPASHRRR
jgi:hypothetical protein